MSGQLAKAGIGRPSKYSAQIAESICWRIADGQSLRAICRDPALPDARTVHVWVETNEKFRQQYARARVIQSHAIAEEAMEIVDDTSGDIQRDADGNRVSVDYENVQRSRLRFDARRWMAGKLNPKVYGDKMLHTGADGEGPIEHRLNLDYKLLSDTELAEFKRLLEKAMRKQVAAPATPMIEGEIVEDEE